MPTKHKIKVTPSTGNVFRDLGFPAEEAAHLLIRADLLIQLQKAVASRRLTQAVPAKVLHISQPRVSDLLRGRLDLFSTDTLLICWRGWASGCGLSLRPLVGGKLRSRHTLNPASSIDRDRASTR